MRAEYANIASTISGERSMEMRAESRALDKLYKRRDRYEIPDWQREKVWPIDKKRRLIDSVLRGWKLPKFYFQKTEEGFEVVDGQQRLSAIWEFLDGHLKLTPEQEKEFGGADYISLPETLSDAFDDYEIEYDEITGASEEEVKEFFQRLQEGLPLTSSERLNSVHSALRDYCAKAAKHPFFAKSTVASSSRYAYFDIVAKVVAIELEGLDVGLRYDEIKRIFQSNAAFSPQSAAAKRVNKALTYLREAFPETYKQFRNRTIIQSVITLVCYVQQSGMTADQGKQLSNFIAYFLAELTKQVELGQKATDPDYLAFQRTVNANAKSAARTRQNIMLRKLYQAFPDFYSTLSHSPDMAKGIAGDITRLSKTVRDFIGTCNESYAAAHGKDLFKATNKTASALSALGSSVVSIEQYKQFIDRLYFVFHESTGQRFGEGKTPPSFVDVNQLRTMLQHDADHGKEAKSAKRRKELAAVFARYSGAPSPEAVDPARFPLIQANILGALTIDLNVLAKALASGA